MSITIKAKNTTLTPSIKEAIEEKISTLDVFLKPEHKIRVEIEIEKRHKTGLTNKVEIDIQPNGYFAEGRATDFYGALDLALPKIKEQMAKAKDKKITLRRKSKR